MKNLITKLLELTSFDDDSKSKATLEPFMTQRSDNDPLVMNLNFLQRNYLKKAFLSSNLKVTLASLERDNSLDGMSGISRYQGGVK